MSPGGQAPLTPRSAYWWAAQTPPQHPFEYDYTLMAITNEQTEEVLFGSISGLLGVVWACLVQIPSMPFSSRNSERSALPNVDRI